MQVKWIKNTQFQSLLLLILSLFFVGHFVLLSPSSLEEDFNGVRVIPPQELLSFLKNEPTLLAKEVPDQEAPTYSVRGLQFYSSVEHQPNWKIIARKSNVYQKEQILYGIDVTIFMQDGTTVQSKEAVMHLDRNEIRFYGNVIATLKNGTVVHSEFLKALTRPVTQLEIPTDQKVTGENTDRTAQVDFESYGLFFVNTGLQELKLLSQVVVTLHHGKTTVIRSDRATYTHLQNHLSFHMDETDPLDRQFVTVHEPDLDLKSRSLEVELSPHQELQTITAVKDVFIRDSHDSDRVSTATSGRAVYLNLQNQIQLEDFPQVYQDDDTITGDTIVFNRNSDTIEVKESNAIYNKE